MKKIYTTLCFLVTGLFAFGQAVPELMYYKFDTGNTLTNDASAPVGTNPAMLTGTGLTVGGSGMVGTTLIGTGTSSTNDFVNTGWNTNLSGSWTIGFWTSNVPTGSTLWYIFGDNTANSFRCFTNGVAGAGNWLLRCTGCNMPDIIANGAATSTSNYVHFVHDATAGMMRAYINGVKTDSSSITTAVSALVGTAPFKVGAYGSNSNLSGSLDEFRIYSRALGDAEILATYNISLGGCGNPDNIHVSAADCDEIELSWDSDTASLATIIEYGPTGFTQGAGTTVVATASPYTISGLVAGNDYDVYMRDSCSEGNSMWVDTTLSTLPLPVADFSDSLMGVTPVDAQYSFNATASSNGNTYIWDFGDGNNGTGMVVTHTYLKDSTYTVVLIVEGDCGVDSLARTITVAGISVDAWTMNHISVYPNPTKGQLFFDGLKSSHGTHTFIISDAQGKRIFMDVKDHVVQSYSTDLSGFAPGVYFVEVHTAEGTMKKSVILTK